MLKRFFNLFTKADIPKQTARWLMPESEAEQWVMPDPATHESQSQLYSMLDYIGAVVDIVTETCIDADFDIVNDSTEKEIEGHEFEKLLKRPNEFDSRTEFLRGHFSNRKLYGNSYWFLNKANQNATPDELWILSPAKIKPALDGRMGLRGYVYYPGNGAEIPLETWEILHCKSFNPFSRYVGLSAIVSLAVTSYGAKAAKEWNTRLFANNNARLPGIIAFAEYIQDTDWQRMKKEVSDAASKRNNMMLRGVGKGGVEWMQGGATQKEMEFLAGLNANKQDIYDRLAPGLYSAMQTSALTNGVNGMILFLRSTIQPLLRELTDKLNSEILPLYGEGISAEYENVVPEDQALRLQEIREYSATHTADEVRQKYWSDGPDPDTERGKLYPGQITAQTAKPEPEKSEEEPEEKPEEQEETPVDIIEKTNPEPEDEVKADLLRWKRKALRVGGVVEFISSHIPADVHTQIIDGLKAATNADEIAAVFEYSMPTETKQPAFLDDTLPAIKALADAINNAVAATKQTDTVTPAPVFNMTMPAISLTAQMPEQGTVTVNVPNQPPPVVNVTTPPQPTPVVNVAAPVNNVTVQPADVIVPPMPTEATITTDKAGNKTLKVKNGRG